MRVPLTVNDFLARAAQVYGSRIGILDEPDQPAPSLGELTYREVWRLARAQAAALDRLSLGSGERVAIVSQNAARFLISFFGVSGWGRILVPINFRLNAAEVGHIVEHSGARVLLVDPELDEPLRSVRAEHRFILGADADLYLPHTEPVAWEPDEDATATLNYTSGTTARPKGVQLTHRNLWVNAVTFGWQVGVSDWDVYLHTLPMFHVNGWGMPYAITGMGARHLVLRKVSGREILRRVETHGVTLLCGAPTVVSMVLEAARDWPGEIPGRGRTRMVVAGAPPPTRTLAQVESELGWEFIQLYGLTETTPFLTMNRGRAEMEGLSLAERGAHLCRAGAPALGVQLRIDDQGEVLARSSVVMEGYWNQPEATAEVIRDGWFHTGDGGALDQDGYLCITDRKKDVIITGGENVSSIEVENCLFSHAAVAEVAVIGVPDEKWGEAVKALVVPRPGATATEAELIAFCRSRLAHYKCPASVEFRAELPRTATGKLQKFRLRAPYWEARGQSYGKASEETRRHGGH
jgi:fatty-acyl-CoA synthase